MGVPASDCSMKASESRALVELMKARRLARPSEHSLMASTVLSTLAALRFS
jgi:hypothetical protein